jgi:chromatin segregation and condensation protein Rec8/ScpA/Scc1 (kleisin family)
MIAWLKDRFSASSFDERSSAEPLFGEQASPARRVALFLAILEMAREGSIRLDQQGLFTPIFIYRTTHG